MNSNIIIDHVKNPRNIGEMKDANALGEAVDPISNDLIYVYLKIKDDKILDISFQTFGSPTALASSSILSELIKGKTLHDAEKITAKDISVALNSIPEEKIHSCNLAINGLHAAIKNYSKK